MLDSLASDTFFPVLDPRQEQRIEAVHRGFLYQHLYAVGCLFLAALAEVSAVVVERDEDVEVIGRLQRLYVQVKTRSRQIIFSDIGDVLQRFEQIRAEHVEGRREGRASFVIIVNQPLGRILATQVQAGAIPEDVHLQWPGQAMPDTLMALPPAWRDIPEAVQWCSHMAESLPFSLLAPDSLVWKLAGRVLMAASGGAPYADHTFRTDSLPSLFEQLLIQLQDFPSSPSPYRPQVGEPSLDAEQRVRIICGFSGAGKTAWASQAALHSSQTCTYFDVGDLPGPAIASSLVRELSAKLVETEPGALRRILLPGATGIESLRALDIHLRLRGIRSTLVLDNAHRVPANSLLAALGATTHLRFVLLCQPSGSIPLVEARLGATLESLLGWDLDAVAAECAQVGAHGSAVAIQRLRTLTAGMPLYVQSAVRIAASEFGGDIAQYCAALDAQTHTVEMA
jgi:hypothetical protein